MEKVRVGVIGAGKMGVLHSCLFNKLRNSELVAICDNTPMNLKLLRSILPKVKLYEDYGKMIDEAQLDLTVVTTPVFLHKRMAQKAIEAGSSVFVEKPLALNGKECADLERLVQNKVTLVGYCRRFMGTYNLARQYIGNGPLGEVESFDSHMYVTQVSDQRTGWQFDAKRSGGGVVMDLGSHGVDMLQYLLKEVVEVSGSTEQDLETTVEDSARLKFRLASGKEGGMEVSWTKPGFRLPELMFDIAFEKGRIRVCEKFIEITDPVKGDHPITLYKQMLEKGVQINIAGQEYTHEDEHIIESIKAHTPTRCDFAAAAKTNYIIEAAYGSMRDGSKWKPARWDA
jgi:predicted dehydrogenase